MFIKKSKGILEQFRLQNTLGELMRCSLCHNSKRKMENGFIMSKSNFRRSSWKRNQSKEEILMTKTSANFQKTSRVYANNAEALARKPLLQSYLRASITKPIPLDKNISFRHYWQVNRKSTAYFKKKFMRTTKAITSNIRQPSRKNYHKNLQVATNNT